MSHTPGPWTVTDDTPGNGEGRCFLVEGPTQTDGFDSGYRWLNKADATLMAAAPEMLEALRVAQSWLANSIPVTHIDGPTPLPLIAAAIAKAEQP